MPDTLRKFKIEEEDHRQRLLSGFATDVSNQVEDNDRHLERFFVITSYAYEERPQAASEFWADTDSNLYGFLQWFSRRVSTPVVGAFCEMFRAISEGEDCAMAAHSFLVEGSNVGRHRRSATLSWNQIFDELEFYASKVRESPTAGLTNTSSYNGKPKAVDIDEPETPAMLECYLRLVAHLCTQSEKIKSWVLSQPRKVFDMMFLLCNNTVPSRIRARAYDCVRAFLDLRTPEVTTNIWTALDSWVSSGFSSGGNIARPAKISNSSAWAEEVTFKAISQDFTEMNAFVLLLTALISATAQGSDLHDALPFPEQLGSSYRMQGIDPYVDLVLGKIFATRLANLEVSQTRILSNSVFAFIGACLDSFNEDLLILAHRTHLSLDDAMSASSLLNYVRFHPFSRILEWMFNDKVIATLFSVSHQNISEVTNAQADSPLVFALSGSIRAMNLVMDLQSTYFDIARPLVKTQSSGHRRPVSNPALASFEDIISMHLRIVADLAYYAGSGHQELAEACMELLKKFSMSRKLNTPQSAKFGSRVISNRLVGILQGNSDIEPIAKAMTQNMVWDRREQLAGPEAPCFVTKYAILDFLEQTLSTNPGQPNLAHALLGFVCHSSSVELDPTGVFAQHHSLFDAVLKLSVEYPESIDGRMFSWSCELRGKAAHIIHLLWTSTLTSALVLPVLKENAILSVLWNGAELVSPEVLWEGGTAQGPTFFFDGGSKAFEWYVKERFYLYSLGAAEFRLASAENTSLWMSQLLSTMFGVTIIDDEEIPNPMVFDMLDFLDMEIINGPAEPETPLLEGIDLSTFVDTDDAGLPYYNVKLIGELLALKVNHLKKTGSLPDQAAQDKATADKLSALAQFHGINRSLSLEAERLLALQAWSDLVAVLVRKCSTDSSDRAAMALQALQTISPKLEYYAALNKPETKIVASLVQGLLDELDFEPVVLQAGRVGEIASDKLFQLFKVSLRAIGHPDTSTELHESFYNICYRYLTSIAGTTTSSTARQLGTQTIRAAGDNLIDTICEDAYGAAGTCSIAALLLLDSLAQLAIEDNSQYVTDSLVRSNFISIL
ncbi:MAG: hypothetical protein LQ340_004498, partial [Diploschistes diacapsis]